MYWKSVIHGSSRPWMNFISQSAIEAGAQEDTYG